MNPDTIRKKIESEFSDIFKDEDNLIFEVESGAYGHSAGDAIEGWLKSNLLKNGWDVYYTHEFLSEVFPLIGKDKTNIINYLDNLWWGNLIHTKRQINDFIKGEEIGPFQQSGADIVLFYGNNIDTEPEKLILINAKSHNIDRMSRAPNIISAQKILTYFKDTLQKDSDMINNFEYWFFGVNNTQISPKLGKVESIHIKDLFKIDTDCISQINFDAAIQIQFHLADMPEIKQTKLEFIDRLSDLFIEKWKIHSERKEKKYEKLYDDIKKELLYH